MTTIAEDDTRVIAGVDTHKDFHVAVVLDELGRKLDTETFPTTTRGYREADYMIQKYHGKGFLLHGA